MGYGPVLYHLDAEDHERWRMAAAGWEVAHDPPPDLTTEQATSMILTYYTEFERIKQKYLDGDEYELDVVIGPISGDIREETD